MVNCEDDDGEDEHELSRKQNLLTFKVGLSVEADISLHEPPV